MAEQLEPLAESINQNLSFHVEDWTEVKEPRSRWILPFTDEHRLPIGKTYCPIWQNRGVGSLVKVFDVNAANE